MKKSHTTMRINKFLFILSTVILVGCGKIEEHFVVSATGSIYECLVVINDNPLTQEQRDTVAKRSLQNEASAYTKPIATTYDLVSAIMAADMPNLPQMEPYFRLSKVSSAQFDDFLKPTRNILIVDINPKQYTQQKVTVSVNTWSTPQAVCRIQSPSQEEFVTYWLEHGEEIREWFVNQEIQRQISFYQVSTNHDARSRLQTKMQCDILLPEDYIVIMDTTLTVEHENSDWLDKDIKLLWCCNNKGTIRRDIVVYSYPYTDQNTFTEEYLNAQRDAILGRVVSTSIQGSYMGTEYKHFAEPSMRQITVQGNEHATEIRGLWKIFDGGAMGGPYVSHTRLDQVNGRVITAETFIYAAGQKKRTALRQAEAILYTLKLPQDSK